MASVSSESLRGSGTLAFCLRICARLSFIGASSNRRAKRSQWKRRPVPRVGVGGGNSQEIPDESCHKGGHPCLLAHAHSSSQPVSHAQVAGCGGVPQNYIVYFNLRMSSTALQMWADLSTAMGCFLSNNAMVWWGKPRITFRSFLLPSRNAQLSL